MRGIAWQRRPEVAPEEAQRKDAEEVVRGSGVNFLGNFAKISKSLYFLIVTRFVGAGGFGLYTLGWSLIDLVGKFGLFGLDRGVVRFVARHHSDGDAQAAHRTVGQALGMGLIASLIVTALVWAAAPWAAATVFHKPELSPILRILSLTIPLMVVSSMLLAGIRALRIMRYEVYVKSIAEPLVLLVSGGTLCALGWTTRGLAFAYVFAAAFGLALAVRYFARLFSPSRCIAEMSSLPLRSPLISFSAPIPFYDAIYNLMSRLDLFVLAMFLPASAVGVYAITCEVAWVIKDIRQAVDPIFMPVASGLLHEDQRARLSALLASVARWILTLELAYLMGMGLWGGAILSIFGPGFSAGFWSMILLAVGYGVNGAFGSAEVLLMMAGRSGVNLINTVFLVAVNLGLNLFLIPRHGIAGAALAAVISLTLINLLRVVQARVILGVHPFRRSLLKPVCAAVPAFAVGLLLMRAPWSVLSVLALPLYFGLLRAFGMEAEDTEMLEKLHRKVPLLRRWAAVWDRVGIHLRSSILMPLSSRRSNHSASDAGTHAAG